MYLKYCRYFAMQPSANYKTPQLFERGNYNMWFYYGNKGYDTPNTINYYRNCFSV